MKILKKAQAAMEFLINYGWSILVVLVVFGAMTYFGVLNPSKMLPDTCTMPAGFSCSDQTSFAVTDMVHVTIINRQGSSITSAIVEPLVQCESGFVDNGKQNIYSLGFTPGQNPVSQSNPWKHEDTATITFTNCDLDPGTRATFNFNLNYAISGGLTRQAAGSLGVAVR